MSEQKHTPGPWHTIHRKRNGNDDYYEIGWSPYNELVSDGVYGKANARLVAAAPDMYEACNYGVENHTPAGSFLTNPDDLLVRAARYIREQANSENLEGGNHISMEIAASLSNMALALEAKSALQLDAITKARGEQ